MAEKPKAPRKRPAPTIDLTATEVNPANSRPDSDFVDRGFAWLRAHTSMATMASAAIGGAMVALVLALLWIVGQIPNRYATGTGVARSEIDALTQRLGKIEENLAKLPSNAAGINERIAANDNAMKSLGIALTALNKRADEAAAAAADARAKAEAAGGDKSAAMDNRLATLEKSAQAAHEQIAKNTGADVVARLALSASALRDAVMRGQPFAAELAAAKSLTGDAGKSLQALDDFAATGVPSDKQLADELHALLPQMLKTSAAPPNAGFFAQLQANAGNLVRIRPVDAPPGNDATSVLARIESGLFHPNIAPTIADVELLPPNVRAPAQDWLRRAKARQAALEAARQFAADAARGLRNP